jgi:hypothetical protein
LLFQVGDVCPQGEDIGVGGNTRVPAVLGA